MLREKLKLRIKEDKNISFSEYMEIILFDKDYGLYEKDQVLGKEGHFITSPLVSKHFSHCIAKNFIRVSNDEKINYILEFGAGNAELARDLILYLKKKKCLPKRYYFLEKSSKLTKIQKKAVDALELGESVDFIWINKYEDLPSEAFIITNELFDCIPTEIIKHKNNLFHKAYVNDEFKISWQEYDLFSEIQAKYLSLPSELIDNYLFEFSPAQYDIINNISRYIDKAYFLIFDYGYSANELYIDDRMNGTIACIKDHLSDFNPLEDIGEKDVSSFVNFSYLKNILEYNKWSPYAFMSQANYLLSYDILDDIDIENIGELTSIKKLIMPNQMGEIFKVLIAGKNIKNNSNKNFIKNDIMKL